MSPNNLLDDFGLAAFALGVILAAAGIRMYPGVLRTTLAITSSILILITASLLFVYGSRSIDLVFEQQLLFSAMATLGAVITLVATVRTWRSSGFASIWQRSSSPVSPGFAFLVVTALAVFFCFGFIGDVALERTAVAGEIEAVEHSSPDLRSPSIGSLFIGGVRYNATLDVVEGFRPGQVVRIEAGAITNIVYEIDELRDVAR